MRKSLGPDGIPAHFLKEVPEPIAAPLTKLFRKCLETDHISPNQWKHSNATLFKKGIVG